MLDTTPVDEIATTDRARDPRRHLSSGAIVGGQHANHPNGGALIYPSSHRTQWHCQHYSFNCSRCAPQSTAVPSSAPPRLPLLRFKRSRLPAHRLRAASVLASRKGQSILFTKGAAETVLAKCTQALTNASGAAEPLTDAMRAHLEPGCVAWLLADAVARALAFPSQDFVRKHRKF